MTKHNPELTDTANNSPWQPWQKFSFRFFFLFLGVISCLCWDVIVYIAYTAFYKDRFDLGKLYESLTVVFYWLDRHIYHTGYNPKTHGTYPGDNHFGVIFYLTILILSIIAAIIWSVLDKNRRNYDKLLYWFSVYLRYILAITIFCYGIDKLIPVQMSRPNVLIMSSPYGEIDMFTVLWAFMGMSPGYMIFSGALEIVACLLLFSRRTAVAGYILIFAILSNVVALNWFYNIPVKLFSSQLLLFSLFLLSPFLKNIFQYFFNNKAVPLSSKQYLFKTKWKKHLLLAILIFIPLILTLLPAFGTYKRYQSEQAAASKEKIYDVTTFVAKDTLPPLTTDTLRWKRVFLYIYGDQFIISNMKDNKDWYSFEVDSLKKTFTLHNNPNKATWKTFHYTYPAKNQLHLSGKWKGQDISVSMKLSPADSIPLNKEGMKFIQE